MRINNRVSTASSKPRVPRVSEAHVQQTVTDLLVADGWRAIRTDPVSDRGRGKGFGELGMPDYLYIRYWDLSGPESDVLWIEFKALGKKPKPRQAAWHVAERARGATVLVIDDIDFFMDWYATSGLARKVLKRGTKSKESR